VADPSKLVPPIFGLPSPTEQVNAVDITFHQKNRQPTVVEDVEKGLIVEDVDTCAWSIGVAMAHKQMPMVIIEE